MLKLTTANITDRNGATAVLEDYVSSNDWIFSRLLKLLVDGGCYIGEKFAQAVKELIGAIVEVAKRNELHKFEVIPKRWIEVFIIPRLGKTAIGIREYKEG